MWAIRLCTAGFLAVSAVPAADNFIDQFVLEHANRKGAPVARQSSDNEFLRRVHLDVTGKLPTAEESRKFLARTDPDKRNKAIDALFPPLPEMGMRSVAEHPFMDRWTFYFNDLFKNGELLGEGINTFHTYIYKSLTLNIPYDEFVRDMLTASTVSTWSDGAANFIARSHVFEGDGYQINHEDTADEIAINTTKIFLGVNLECVSCHDGHHHLEKINIWLSQQRRAALFRQASFFGKTFIGPSFGRFPQFRVKDSAKGYDPSTTSSLRPPRKKTEDVTPTFLLTGEHSQAGESDRQAYARMITEHPQFARATVNLFWAELMGKGIVENPFDFDMARQDPKNPPPAPWTLQPTHPELLDALAEDFRKSGYDLRHLLKQIVKSKTYQLSTEAPKGWSEVHDPLLTRRSARRLSAPQLWDAVADVTGVYPDIKVTYSEKKVKYMMQSRSPMDLERSSKTLYKTFMSFGQCDRYQTEPDQRPSMVQAALLLNDGTLQDRVNAAKSSRVKALASATGDARREAIEDLYFTAFSRPPAEHEIKTAEQHLSAQGEKGAEDLVWAIVNSIEFLFN